MWKTGRLGRSSSKTILQCGEHEYTVLLAGKVTDAELDSLIGRQVTVNVLQEDPNGVWVSAVEAH